MDAHIRIDSANSAHTRITLFMNGGNCDNLCMNCDEFIAFRDALRKSPGRFRVSEVIEQKEDD